MSLSTLPRAAQASVLCLALAAPFAGEARAAGTVPEEDATPLPEAPAVRRTSFMYEVSYGNIPKSARQFDVWVPLPARNEVQTVSDLVIQAPPGGSFETEKAHGNRIYHGASGPRGGQPYNLNIQFVVERREVRHEDLGARPAIPPKPPANLDDFTRPEELLSQDRKIKSLSRKVTGKQDSIAGKARAIYDWVLENIELSRGGGNDWGKGDLKSVLEAGDGNSLDVATAFVGLARAAGIPARTIIGFKLPLNASSGTLTGYHAWAEFWAPGWGWVPVDPALAMQRPSRRPYYFGSLDPHRIRVSTGRGLTLQPPQKGDPLGFLLYPYAEIDGEPLGGSAYRFRFLQAPEPAEASGGR